MSHGKHLVRGSSDGPDNVRLTRNCNKNDTELELELELEPFSRRRRGSSWGRACRDSVTEEDLVVMKKHRTLTTSSKGLWWRQDRSDNMQELIEEEEEERSEENGKDTDLPCSLVQGGGLDSVSSHSTEAFPLSNNNGIDEETFQAIVLEPLLRGSASGLDLGGLALSHEWLGAAFTTRLLSAAASRGEQLEYLNLAGNCLGDAGALSVAAVLYSLPALRELGLGCNRIGDEGLVGLAEALDHSSNDMPKYIISQRAINLEDNMFGLCGVTALSRTLCNCSCSLVELDLASNLIGDEQACILAGALASNTSLKQLGLALNNVSCFGARAFGTSLANNTSLLELDLSGNAIGAEGCCALAQGMACNQTLHTLLLRGNTCGNRGAAALAIAMTSYVASRLRLLDLRGNGMEQAPLKALARAAADYNVEIKLAWASSGNLKAPSPAESLDDTELHTDACDCETSDCAGTPAELTTVPCPFTT